MDPYLELVPEPDRMDEAETWEKAHPKNDEVSVAEHFDKTTERFRILNYTKPLK